MKEILKLDHIQKYYGNGGNVTKAIQDISFSVQEGEFVGIMGASGSGKTTLLNCISTIDTVSAGHIYLDGTDVTEINEKQIARFRRENLGFVFQDFNLLDTLTISENIALALTINKVPAGEIDGRVREMAGKLNITDILDKYPYQVSGGQKQRCACARAIINQPKLILADEPTGALDTENCSLLNALKKSLHLSRRKTCFAHPVLLNFFFVYRGVSFKPANTSFIPSNSFMRDNSNIPLLIAVLQQFFEFFLCDSHT